MEEHLHLSFQHVLVIQTSVVVCHTGQKNILPVQTKNPCDTFLRMTPVILVLCHRDRLIYNTSYYIFL